MIYKLSEWKEKQKSYTTKGLSTTYFVREKIKYRNVETKKGKIEEGIILEYFEKERGSKEDFKSSQQHLVGYHYISLIDKDNNDLLWIQGNINNKQYAIFKSETELLLNWCKYEKALKFFLNELKKLNIILKYKIEKGLSNVER